MKFSGVFPFSKNSVQNCHRDSLSLCGHWARCLRSWRVNASTKCNPHIHTRLGPSWGNNRTSFLPTRWLCPAACILAPITRLGSISPPVVAGVALQRDHWHLLFRLLNGPQASFFSPTTSCLSSIMLTPKQITYGLVCS